MRGLLLVTVLVAMAGTAIAYARPPQSKPTGIPAMSASVDAAASIGTLRTGFETVLIYFQRGWPNTQARDLFHDLRYRFVRLSTDDDLDPPSWPGTRHRNDYDFAELDRWVEAVKAAGARPVMNTGGPTLWLWDCAADLPSDRSWGEYADHLGRIVSYYNRGSFVTEDGRTIVNPKGTQNRVEYWDLWNEPELWIIVCPDEVKGVLSADEYVRMWNATAPRLRAIDPEIKLIGPASGNPHAGEPNYAQALMARGRPKPDALTFHLYGGYEYDDYLDRWFWDMLDGDPGADYLSAVKEWREWAGNTPIWITEFGVNSARCCDPTGRPLKGFGAAWGAAFFRISALAGVEHIFQFTLSHIEGTDHSLIDRGTGRPLLQYWRDYHLSRYFPPGSTLLKADSPRPDVEILAARPPGSRNVHVLVINRQVDGPTTIGGKGKPATVELTVGNLPGVGRVTQRILDDRTQPASGPGLTILPATSQVSVQLPGYGIALLQFEVDPFSVPPDAPPLRAELIDRAVPGKVAPGQVTTLSVRYANTGSETWRRDDQSRRVELAVVGVDWQAYAQGGAALGWLSPTRLTTIAAEEVAPGGVGDFVFRIRAPELSGTYRLAARPVAGGEWLQEVAEWNIEVGVTTVPDESESTEEDAEPTAAYLLATAPFALLAPVLLALVLAAAAFLLLRRRKAGGTSPGP